MAGIARRGIWIVWAALSGLLLMGLIVTGVKPVAADGVGQPGDVDTSFQTGSGFDGSVTSVVVQADGKSLVGGMFYNYGGSPAGHLVRLNEDGSRDLTFDVGSGGEVRSLAMQPDGKVLVGGGFTSFDGQPGPRLVRLNADGSRDPAFRTGTGFNSYVYSVAVQPDGRVLAGGAFTAYDGQSAFGLVRLNADGSRDTSFQTGAGFNGPVTTVVLEPDGTILVGGWFASYDTQFVGRLVRLNADGSRDASLQTGTGFRDVVYGVAMQQDGKALVGGNFTTFDGLPADRLVRLNADGSRDATFDFGIGPDGEVRTVAVQKDGKILVGGNFLTFNRQYASRLVRLHPDGSRDGTFETGLGFKDIVYTVAEQPNGKVIVGGGFTTYNGTTANRIVRLFGMTPPVLALDNYGLSFATQVAGSSSRPRTITITNEGPADLALPAHGVTVTGADHADFGLSRDDCSTRSVPAHMSCTVSVVFTPASKGAKTASLTITSNAASSPDHVALSGTGTPLSAPGLGRLVAWGNNDQGQTDVPAGLTGVIAVSGGGSHSLAVKSDGTVLAWGDNSRHQSDVPTGLSRVTAVAGGAYHSLALKSDGTVVAWGDNGYQQSDVPAGLSNVTAIYASPYHNLALKSDGTVAAWGINTLGQTDVPAGLTSVTAVAAGIDHSLALRSDGTVVAWGNNSRGQLDVPTGLTHVIAIATGAYHSVALKDDGTVVAWGDNQYGQVDVPSGLNHVVAVSARFQKSLALKSDGTVVAWGDSAYHQSDIPDGLTEVTAIAAGGLHNLALQGGSGAVGWGLDNAGQSSVPQGLSGITRLAAVGHVLALKTDGTVTSWGSNGHGQATVPDGITAVKSVAAGAQHSLALKDDGAVVAWGANTDGQAAVPPGLDHVTAIAAGHYHSLALRSDGTVVAWGNDANGQSSVPPGLADVVAVAAGAYHSLAVKSDGTVVAWGRNSNQEITIPAGLNAVTAISAGDVHSLALKSDGTVVAWGTNVDDQIVVPSDLSDVTAIASGVYHNVALKSDGNVVAWGADDRGQASVPSGLKGVTSIAAGVYNSLAMAPVVAPEVGDVTISGTAAVGQTLTASTTATGMPTASVRYQWQQSTDGQNWSAIASATASTYTLDENQYGKQVRVSATATNGVLPAASRVSGSLAVPLPPPTVNAVAPASGPAKGGTSITVTGSGFQSPTVTVGGRECLGLSWTSTRITCATPAGTGTASIVVTNVDGQEVTRPDEFTFIPAPVVTAVTPSRGPQSGGTEITITGAHFVGPLVSLDRRDCTSVTFSDSVITCFTPGGMGTVDVVVTNADGQDATVTEGFTFVAAPTTLDVRPAVGPAVGGTRITITGARFDAATVTLGGNDCTDVLVSPVEIECTIPAGSGTVDVVVTNADGQHSTLTEAFTYIPVPTITAIAPTSGPPSGGTEITITGTHLDPATVSLAGNECTVLSSGPTEIRCTTPAGTGWANLVVVNTDGQMAALTGAFTYVPGPSVTEVSPTTGPQSGGTEITITGNGFDAPTVSVGGKECVDLTVAEGQITCTTPAGTGQVNVKVTNIDGQHATLTDAFTYWAPPTITRLDPASGPESGGTQVTIMGANFDDPTVTLDGNACTGLVADATRITCTTPPGTGRAALLVTNAGGQTVADAYVYIPAPTIDGVSPTSGPESGGTELRITGTHFDAAIVTLGGNDCTDATVTGTQITCTTPEGSGVVNIRVTNADEQLAMMSDAFTYVPAPTITGVSPSFGPQAGGTTITITGTHFNAATVTLGDNDCTDVSVTGTQITCATPAGTGTVDLTVTNADGQIANRSEAFSYSAASTISAVMPDSGAARGGVLVRITGSGFDDPVVIIGGVVCSVRKTGSDEISCITGRNTSGRKDVVVVNSDGQRAVLTGGFTYDTHGRAIAWADNSSAQVFVPAGVGESLSAVSAGGRHTLGVTSDGTVVAWGNNDVGQADVPLDLRNVTAVAAGDRHSVALRADGTVAAWGDNEFGQSSVPAGLDHVTAIAAGQRHTLALRVDGSVVAWGSDDSGQSTVPAGLDDVIAIAAGQSHSLAVKADGTVRAWGANDALQTDVPSGLDHVVAVSAGSEHSLALRVDGTVVAWGSDSSGQTVVPDGLEDVVAIAAGQHHSLALKANGKVMGWGGNTSRPIPVLRGHSDVTSIAAGQRHSVALVPMPLTVTGISPASGPTTGGGQVRLTGTEFDRPSVTIDKHRCSGVTYTSSTITCTLPPGKAGLAVVAVRNITGDRATLTEAFRYTEPGITGIKPDSGPVTGGTKVTISGTDFDDPTVVIDRYPCRVSASSGTEIACTTTPGASGRHDVEVTNSTTGQTVSLKNGFTYQGRSTHR